MKYIATTVTGYALMTRDIEVEIDEAKLETALEEAMHKEDDWNKPVDEWWIDFEMFTDHFLVGDEVIYNKIGAIVKKWKALPDCIKVRDCEMKYFDDWNDEPHVQTCKKWLRSRGWAPLPDEEGVWFRKK